MIPPIRFPSDFPVIHTAQLTLCQHELTDAKGLFELRSNIGFMKYLGKYPMQQLSEAEDYIRKKFDGFKNKRGISWKICKKDNTQFIGYLGFWVIEYEHYRTEIGYGIHPSFQGQGYMKEALKAATSYMLTTMNIHHIKADIDPLNIASRNTLLAVGFRKNAYVRENYYFNGKFIDSEYYGMISKDL